MSTPDSPQQNHFLFSQAKTLCDLFANAGYPTMLAGGCVRDRLLGIQPNDYDLATTAEPEQTMLLLKEHGYRVIPVGLDHGTVCAVAAGTSFEITTLRRDVACDGRHAKVAFGTDFSTDAQRRDFTINALFEDRHGQIHDYVGGLEDLAAQRLRFVGEADQRIKEDYLRILRYFRFIAKLGWQPSTDHAHALKSHRAGLAQLSQERIVKEMDRIIGSRRAAATLAIMADLDILRTLYPWLDRQQLPSLLDALAHNTLTNLEMRWLLIFLLGSSNPWPHKTLKSELMRLRFPKTRKNLVLSITHWYDLASPIDVYQHLFRAFDNGNLNPTEFRALIRCCPNEPRAYSRASVCSFLDLFEDKDPPLIPSEWLLDLPPSKRGRLTTLLKIVWYSTPRSDTKFLEQCAQDPWSLFDLFENEPADSWPARIPSLVE